MCYYQAKALGRCAAVVNPGADAVPVPSNYSKHVVFVGDGTWDGGTEFCTEVGNFDIVGRGHCARGGYDRKGFFAIDTGAAADWTQSLSD